MTTENTNQSVSKTASSSVDISVAALDALFKNNPPTAGIAQYSEFASLTSISNKAGPCQVDWKGFCLIQAGQVLARINPIYLCTLNTVPNVVSLRNIGVQDRTEVVSVAFLTPVSGKIGMLMVDRDINKDADLIKGPFYPVPSRPLGGYTIFDLKPSNQQHSSNSPLDHFEYGLDLTGFALPFKLVCWYNIFVPVAQASIPAQLEDGGPPPIPPGAQH